MKPLSTIKNFGSVDADNDQLLYDAFEDHEAYLNLVKGDRFLIIGRKGSGKTAIFKTMLRHKEENNHTFGFTFSDYPWNYHDAQARAGVQILKNSSIAGPISYS